MYNLTTIERTMRCSSPIASIDGMKLCVVSTEVHLIHPKVHSTYLVHPDLVFHLGKGDFDESKSVLCMKKSAVDQLITPNRSMMTRKRSLVAVNPSIKSNQVINRTYNAG